MRKLCLIIFTSILLAGTAFAKDANLEKLQGTWVCQEAGATGPYVIKGKKITINSMGMPVPHKIKKITDKEITLKMVTQKSTWTYYFDDDDLYINGIGPYKKRD